MGSDKSNEPLHVVFFPFLASSHMFPTLEIARLIAERGLKVTVITTPANAAIARPITDRAGYAHAMDLNLLPFPTPDYGLPDGCENLTVVPLHLAPTFFACVYSLEKPLDGLLSALRPDAIFSDALFPWTTALAAKHRILRLVIQVSSLFALCVQNDLTLNRHYEALSDRSEKFTIPGFPHKIELTKAELPETFNYPFMLDVLREAEMASHGVVFNSFRELEPDYADHYLKAGPSREVFVLGPVAIAGSRVAGKKKPKTGSNRDPCLVWLDSKHDRSVIYVGFGTLSRFRDEQLTELALGLEKAGRSFVWAVKSNGYEWIPTGYEERVNGLGMLVKGWAPQEEILNHDAVGGFLTHCGWNSVLEAVGAGVPMLTWPLHSEQFVHERLLADVLGIARQVWKGFRSVTDEEKVVVPAEAVAEAVVGLMDGGEEVEEMRRRARELRAKGQKAVADGGSSCGDMSRLIEGLTTCRRDGQDGC